MPVIVLLFAGLREAAHSSQLTVNVALPCSVAQLKAAIVDQVPRVAAGLAACRVAVDQEFVSDEHRIVGNEEIALIPPVSGGHDGPARIALAPTALSLQDVLTAVGHENAGGVVTFTGAVRRASRGKEIERLEYEAYGPMALAAMTRIADDIEARIPGSRVAIHHRIGVLAVGEVAVVIAASAPHRAEAFEACRAAIEALKADVPIWKKEVATDGEAWIGQGP